MKKILYILFVAVVLFSSCSKKDSLFSDSLITTEEGKATLALDLKIKGAELQAVETRAGETIAGAEKENVTSLKGYAFVFSEDTSDDDGYGDNSKLLQKLSFKSVNVGGSAKVFITLDEYDKKCFIRLMTCMTEEVYNEMKSLVSQQMVDDGIANAADLTSFSDYKNISVGLQAYYKDAANPVPTELTDNSAFPLASPGINMPNGISQEEVDKVNKFIFMVPVASKVDVTSKASNFTLQEVTLLNGAERARMRSAVLDNDGVSVLSDPYIPTNLGGVVKYEPLAAVGNTTAANPIYFYPNNGDGPFSEEDKATISDKVNDKNPTYLIIKGKADGYDVEGYYKIPIKYKFKTVGANGVVTTATEDTYNIVRNNHYKVNLISVNNAGYPTFDEAVAGPANDIVYDIKIDDPTTDDRNELIVSNNGTHYMEVKGSEVYIKARGGVNDGVDQGVNCTLDFKFVSADKVPEYENNMPKVYFSTDSEYITLEEAEAAVPYGDKLLYTLKFKVCDNVVNANDDIEGNIIVRWGELYKKIPVYYENMHALSGNVANPNIKGKAVFADANSIEGVINDNDPTNDPNNISGFISNGSILANTTFNGRNFDGYVYPTDRSKGIRRVLYAQASNFELLDNVKNGYAQWSEDGSNVQEIVYRSTGTVSSITDGTINTSGVREYEVKGDINSNYQGGFSNFNQSTTWGNSKTFSFYADNIGYNEIGSHATQGSHLSNEATLTLTNFADEKKVYKFKVDQYAMPKFESDQSYFDAIHCMRWWSEEYDYTSGIYGDEMGKNPTAKQKFNYLIGYNDTANANTDFSLLDIPAPNCTKVVAEFIDYPTAAVISTGEVFGNTYYYNGGDDNNNTVSCTASWYVNYAVDLRVIEDASKGTYIQVYRNTNTRYRGCGMVYRAKVKISAYNECGECDVRTLEIGVRDDRQPKWENNTITYDGHKWNDPYYLIGSINKCYWEDSYNVIGGKNIQPY